MFQLQKVIAIGKHLCGAATDLAINSLVNFVRNSVSRTEKTDKDINKNKPVLGIMIALCCHHRCSWKTFAGKKYLLENYGFSPNEFTLLCGLSSWATCGTGKPRNKGNQDIGYFLLMLRVKISSIYCCIPIETYLL